MKSALGPSGATTHRGSSRPSGRIRRATRDTSCDASTPCEDSGVDQLTTNSAVARSVLRIRGEDHPTASCAMGVGDRCGRSKRRLGGGLETLQRGRRGDQQSPQAARA
jgi:hypothetical protein